MKEKPATNQERKEAPSMNLYCIVLSIVGFIGWYLFLSGKALKYIKSFRSMSQEERACINEKLLCKNAAAVFFVAASIFAVAGFSPVFLEKAFTISVVIWLILTGADVYFIGKSKRYTNQQEI